MDNDDFGTEPHIVRSQLLSRLEAGTLDLSVPYHNGMIETHYDNTTEKTHLDVVVQPGVSVVVRRQDSGETMQVIVESTLSRKILEAFARPVAELVLLAGSEPDTWKVSGEGVEVGDSLALQTFIDKIGVFGGRKQHPQESHLSPAHMRNRE